MRPGAVLHIGPSPGLLQKRMPGTAGTGIRRQLTSPFTTHTLWAGSVSIVTKTRAGAVRLCEPVVQAVVPPANEESMVFGKCTTHRTRSRKMGAPVV